MNSPNLLFIAQTGVCYIIIRIKPLLFRCLQILANVRRLKFCMLGLSP